MIRFDLEFVQGLLPDDWMPLEAVIVIKGMPTEPNDTEVGVELFHTSTKGLTSWEAMGMLTAASDQLRRDLLRDD